MKMLAYILIPILVLGALMAFLRKASPIAATKQTTPTLAQNVNTASDTITSIGDGLGSLGDIFS